MKKAISLVICLVIILLLVGCNDNSVPTEVPFEKPTETAAPRYPNEPDIPDVKDLLPSWQSYVQDLVGLYESSDEVKQYSVYDSVTLSLTFNVVCAFYNDGKLTTTRYFSVENNRISLPEDIYYYDGAGAVRTLNDCFEVCPNLEIIGFVGLLSPIGRIDGQGPVLIYDFQEKELEPFTRVESDFTNMEDGFRLRAEYYANQAKIEENIPVFRWKETDDHTDDNGYYDIYGPVDYYDRIVVCPLLDKDGKEGVYLCHLIYLRNKLIGEVVSTESEMYILKRFGEYDEATGTYAQLEGSLYIKTIDEFIKNNPRKTVKGVCFNGEKYVVIGQ